MMQKVRLIQKPIIAIVLLCHWGILVAVEVEENVDVRTSRKVGVYANVLGDPYISLLSGTIAVNLNNFIRIRASSALPLLFAGAVGAGVQFLVPGWKFSPTTGLSYSFSYIFDGFAFMGLTVPIGVDWQFENGFFVALGVNTIVKTFVLAPQNAPIAGIKFLPYLSVGVFFRKHKPN